MWKGEEVGEEIMVGWTQKGTEIRKGRRKDIEI
jgi:hypothetical protein